MPAAPTVAAPVAPTAFAPVAPTAIAAPRNPLDNPEYLAALAAYNAAEAQRRARMVDVIDLAPASARAPAAAAARAPSAAPRGRSVLATVAIVVLLCAVAAALGFFLVDAVL